MAYITQALPRDAGLVSRAAARLAVWFADAAQEMERRRIARRTFNELNALTARELDDLGLHRSQLHSVAYDSACTYRG